MQERQTCYRHKSLYISSDICITHRASITTYPCLLYATNTAKEPHTQRLMLDNISFQVYLHWFPSQGACNTDPYDPFVIFFQTDQNCEWTDTGTWDTVTSTWRHCHASCMEMILCYIMSLWSYSLGGTIRHLVMFKSISHIQTHILSRWCLFSQSYSIFNNAIHGAVCY